LCEGFDRPFSKGRGFPRRRLGSPAHGRNPSRRFFLQAFSLRLLPAKKKRLRTLSFKTATLICFDTDQKAFTAKKPPNGAKNGNMRFFFCAEAHPKRYIFGGIT
jgi:hypothetical protein